MRTFRQFQIDVAETGVHKVHAPGRRVAEAAHVEIRHPAFTLLRVGFLYQTLPRAV